jgi:hypothetical protein
MRGRQWTVKLVSVGVALSILTLGLVSSVPASAATATPACTFNGSSTPIVQGVSAGSTVDVACTGLPELRPYLVLQASLLIGIDPQAAALLSGGGSLSTGTFEAALAALPEIDAASLTVETSDLSGDLSFTYTVPTIQPTDPNATCPPSQQEYNAGLIGCALAMVDLTTQTPLAAGSAVLEYQGFNLIPPNPTLVLSAKKTTPGATVTVSDAPGATTYWWVATLVSLEALLSGGAAPAGTLTVNFLKKGVYVPAANNIVVTGASYNGSTLTLPTISGSFTVPPGVSGTQKVYVLYTASLEGEQLVNVAGGKLKVKG